MPWGARDAKATSCPRASKARSQQAQGPTRQGHAMPSGKRAQAMASTRGCKAKAMTSTGARKAKAMACHRRHASYTTVFNSAVTCIVMTRSMALNQALKLTVRPKGAQQAPLWCADRLSHGDAMPCSGVGSRKLGWNKPIEYLRAQHCFPYTAIEPSTSWSMTHNE
ncbi:hypothetical protein Ancab_040430 [Ancistrocladus abbreviatus]